MRLVKPGRSAAWTKDRIEGLSTPEVRQLRDNAQRLSETEIVGLCDEVLKARPKTGAGKSVKVAAVKVAAVKVAAVKVAAVKASAKRPAAV